MSQSFFSRKTVFGLVAAGLLGSTLLTASTLVTSTQPAFAQAVFDTNKSFSPLVEKVMPAVVSVSVKFAPASSETPDAENLPPQMREFFEQFPQFRDRMPPNQSPRGGAGSGFVISNDGYIVTNNHVVNNASEVEVRFQNGDTFEAKVIGTDPKTDLALLKINADKTFPSVKLAASEAKVGDWVMAVGNPFGLGGTVTVGIISARGRDIGFSSYDDFLQIDASINRGNSGGPTFNLEGDVVGVNTAIYSPSGGSVGIGFAIPAAQVNEVIESLKNTGSVTRGWLGVQIQPVTEELAEGLGLDAAKGAIISGLTEKSPALEAGLKQGDTILTANGEVIDDAKDLARTVAKLKPGAEAPFEIWRDGKPMTVAVKIGAMPGESPKMAGVTKADEGFSLSDLGLNLAPADDGAGVKITEVDPKSRASEVGLKTGDVILEVAGQEVANLDDVKSALKSGNGKRVMLLVKSGDGQRYIALPRDRG